MGRKSGGRGKKGGPQAEKVRGVSQGSAVFQLQLLGSDFQRQTDLEEQVQAFPSAEARKKRIRRKKKNMKENRPVKFQKTFTEDLGRYLVATETIAPGEIIFAEPPIVLGPKQYTPPLCLGCYKALSELSHALCTKCHWPLCSISCSKLDRHQQFECGVFSKAAHPPKFRDFESDCPMYECIMPLRCLLLRRLEDNAFQELLQFPCHPDRRNADAEHSNKVNVVQFIKFLGCNEFSDQDILDMCGRLDVNAFELPMNGSYIRGMFRMGCLRAHDCVRNSSNFFDAAGSLTVKATKEIQPGESITTMYFDPREPNAVRRSRLRSGKYFDCICKRCHDPTELGTYFGSPRCTECSKGLLVPTGDPSLPTTAWKCSEDLCEFEQPGYQILKKLQGLETQLEECGIDAEALETFLKTHIKCLHPKNYLIIKAMRKLSQLPPLDTVAMVTKKRNFCKNVLEVYNVLDPGKTRARGL